MQYVWEKYLTKEKFDDDYKQQRTKYANTKLYAIDYDPRSVKIGKALMLIAGDGKTNVNFANSLDSSLWNNEIKTKLKNFLSHFDDYEKERENSEKMLDFDFDIVITNPPFAGDVAGSVLSRYDLAYKKDKNGKKSNKTQNKMSRDILFIERNLNFLKLGGRMAIVLPQGRFNNTSDKAIREYIAEKGRILAVVGLHVNTFKPHTGTKTSVLFVQKWDDKLCPKVEDYPIFFAVSEKSGKDNSGDYVFVKNENNQPKLDKNGHLVINHDLHNHDGELSDGVAEKFIEWAKSEKLSFLK